MSVPIPLRVDFDAVQLRGLARKTKDGPQARRLLALAAIYDGATRTEAAMIGGVGLQIIRDWVLHFTPLSKFGCKSRQPIILILGPAIFEHNILALDVARLSQGLGEMSAEDLHSGRLRLPREIRRPASAARAPPAATQPRRRAA